MYMYVCLKLLVVIVVQVSGVINLFLPMVHAHAPCKSGVTLIFVLMLGRRPMIVAWPLGIGTAAF